MMKPERIVPMIVFVAMLAGCAASSDIRMVDPRTGVIAICRPGASEASPATTILATVTQGDQCVQELTYYGFQDEDALLASLKTR
jgi:hypothetical protein